MTTISAGTANPPTALIQNEDKRESSTIKRLGKNLLGNTAGVMTYNFVSSKPKKIINRGIGADIFKIQENLSAKELTQLRKASQEIAQKSGIAKKGVEIIQVNDDNFAKSFRLLKSNYEKVFSKKVPDEKLTEMAYKKTKMVYCGQNAFYQTGLKKIFVPDEGLDLAVFHEVGHALNANCDKVGQTLQACRKAKALALPIFLIALFKPNSEKKDGKEENIIGKATSFIKNNVGKLVFATQIPVLLEEGLASIKGNKLAKQMLDPELAKKVSKNNLLAFGTYLTGATFMSLGAALAVKVKDKITKPKQTETQQIAQQLMNNPAGMPAQQQTQKV